MANKLPKINISLLGFLAFMILLVLLRLYKPIYNFSPIAAAALFAMAFFTNRKWALILPITALLITDLLIEFSGGQGFYEDMIFVYGAFVLIGLMGNLIRKNPSVSRIYFTTLAGSIVFFLITNFGAWITTSMYPHTLDGLITSYGSGLPFFKFTFVSDLFYSLVFFGSYALYHQLATSPRKI